MKKLLIGFSVLLLVACGNVEDAATDKGETVQDKVEQKTERDESNEGDSLAAEDSFESDKALPESLNVLKDMLQWESYEVLLTSLKQTESEELIDEEMYISTSYRKQPAEVHVDYKSIGFSNTYYEVYANENEGFMNASMSEWAQLDDYKERLRDTMPARVKLLEMLTLASTYVENEIVEDKVKEIYELNADQLTDVYKNLDAYIVYGKAFDELPKDEQEIVNDTVLNNLKSGRFHIIYDANNEVAGFEVLMAYNESDPENDAIIDVFAFSEEYSNVNNTNIERPEGL